jgi:DNA-binding transcriptional regulator YdaS (Cro superfamily)
MSFNSTIEKAISVAGNQANLAELIGETQSHISGFKNGKRACGFKKRAHIAAIASENPTRAVLETIVEELDDAIPHEAEAKKGILAMLKAFPQT